MNNLLPVVFDAVPNEAALDNIYSNGLYIHANVGGSSMGVGGVFCIGYGSAVSPRFTQLDVDSKRIRFRYNMGAGWTTWKVIATY